MARAVRHMHICLLIRPDCTRRHSCFLQFAGFSSVSSENVASSSVRRRSSVMLEYTSPRNAMTTPCEQGPKQDDRATTTRSEHSSSSTTRDAVDRNAPLQGPHTRSFSAAPASAGTRPTIPTKADPSNRRTATAAMPHALYVTTPTSPNLRIVLRARNAPNAVLSSEMRLFWRVVTFRALWEIRKRRFFFIRSGYNLSKRTMTEAIEALLHRPEQQRPRGTGTTRRHRRMRGSSAVFSTTPR